MGCWGLTSLVGGIDGLKIALSGWGGRREEKHSAGTEVSSWAFPAPRLHTEHVHMSHMQKFPGPDL